MVPRLATHLLCVAGVATGAIAHAAPSANRPNILIAVADDWSFPHAGVYGTTWARTPAFDRVAHEGVLFTNAYTPVAKCTASRACMLTGRNPWQLESGFTHNGYFPVNFRSYAEVVAAAGYAIGFTGKGWGPGLALKADGSERELLGSAFNQRTAPAPTKGMSQTDYVANFADFLASAKDQPWCFWYGGHEPHRDYEYGSGVAQGGKKLSDLDRVPGYWPDEEQVRHDMLDYALEIEHFDRHLGRILDLLAERGELDRTLVIVTSDNGMPFPRSKGQTYEIASHMPLAVRWPTQVKAPGRTVNDYVSFTDLAPTILAAAGVDWTESGMAPTPGRSLLPLLTSETGGRVDLTRDRVLLGRERHDPGRPNNQGYPTRGIVRDGWLFLHNYESGRWPSGNPETGYRDVDSSPTKTVLLERKRANEDDPYWELAFDKRGEDELYDLAGDPDCAKNVVTDPAQAARVAALRDQLARELTAQGDPRLLGQSDYFDGFRFVPENYNDFYERWQQGEKLPIPLRDTDPARP